jgi:hypothetical protein
MTSNQATVSTMVRRSLWLLLSTTTLLAGAFMAWHHPVSPLMALVLFWGWVLLAAWRPGLWLLVVPACLPFMNFSPWTGWLVFEEFDFLLLGALAGGYGRWAVCFPKVVAPFPRGLSVLLYLLAVSGLVALWRGFADADGFAFDWFAGYSDALNSWRVFKSLVFALLLAPLLHQEMRVSQALASQRLARGMVIGIVVVAMAVLWERSAFFGLADFTTHYRTVALFWEMHVGGAAIDSYLALATPFVVWAIVSARGPWSWGAAAVLALLTAYACLTTFSRGVYGAVAGPLVLLAGLLWWQQSGAKAQALWRDARQRGSRLSWRARGGVVLALALVAEVALVLGGGTFMAERLASTERDVGSRFEHWQHGLDLRQDAWDLWFGKGLGRLPANYAAQVPEREFSGAVELQQTFVTVRGPKTQGELGGAFALTQRVDELAQGRYRVTLDVRAQAAAGLLVALCERHLLYERRCQRAFVRVIPKDTGWQTLTLPLRGPTLSSGAWYAPRLAMFSMAVLDAGGHVDVDNVRLQLAFQPDALENGDFSRGLAHWLPAAQSYFVPWHIDNLYLELLIERGGVGLGLTLVLAALALGSVLIGPSRRHPLAPYLAAALCGVGVVGLVSSVMDVPRVAFLGCLLMLFSVFLQRYDEQGK